MVTVEEGQTVSTNGIYSQQTRTVLTASGEQGIISPSGNVSVPYGESMTFTITSNSRSIFEPA
jgi:hypothetical protein